MNTIEPQNPTRPINTLQRQIGLCRRIQLILAGVLLVITVAFYAIGYRPMTARLSILETKIAASRSDLKMAQQKALHLPDLTRQVEKLQVKVERNGKKMPRSPDLGQFMRDVTQISQQVALRDFKLQPMPSRRQELFYELPIIMQFRGDFPNASLFIRQLEDLQRLTRVRRLSIRSKNLDTGTVDVEVTLNIYFWEG